MAPEGGRDRSGSVVACGREAGRRVGWGEQRPLLQLLSLLQHWQIHLMEGRDMEGAVLLAVGQLLSTGQGQSWGEGSGGRGRRERLCPGQGSPLVAGAPHPPEHPRAGPGISPTPEPHIYLLCKQRHTLTLALALAQLMRPGIGRNASCALGDCSTSRPKGCSQPRELWFVDILICKYKRENPSALWQGSGAKVSTHSHWPMADSANDNSEKHTVLMSRSCSADLPDIQYIPISWRINSAYGPPCPDPRVFPP
jgi:hypothetical protein